MQVLYAYFKSENPTISKSENELFHSVQKSYDLYQNLFLALLELTHQQELEFDLESKKLTQSHHNSTPSLLVENRLIKLVHESEKLKSFALNEGTIWGNNETFIKKLYKYTKEHAAYKAYAEKQTRTFADDKAFVSKFFKEILPSFDEFYELLEEESIYWNDECDFVLMMVDKTIAMVSENSKSIKISQSLSKADDIEFTKNLLRKTAANSTDYGKVIDEFTTNWELDRIAFMDIVIMKMALAELMEFPTIPVKVTLNEYIEISKYYSTPKSSNFINGVLDKIINKYKADEKIIKSGRGLLDK